MMRNVAIIGAGVVGLSTALSLQEAFPTYKFTVFAEHFNDETLSDGAGGIFRPDINVHPDPDRVRTWCKDSMAHFLKLIQSDEGAKAGMQLLSGYHLSSTGHPIQNKLAENLVLDWREVNEKELKLFPRHFQNGVTYTTAVADCRYYLPWMKAKFEKAGGTVIRKHITSFEEIPSDYDVIVNCCGLGAKDIADDNTLTPIRGQTIKIKAPWIKHFYYGDDVYIIPGFDYVTLGGIKDYGSWKMEVNEYQKQYIWDKCRELVPSLEKAEILWDWVGLRPHRPSIRVDASFHKCGDKFKMIVHNYGHGGHGVALSWGTAQDVKRIMQKLVNSTNFTLSKL